MGRLSEPLTAAYGANGLRDAAGLCLAFYLLAAVLILASKASLRRSWVDDENPKYLNDKAI
jgi:hypothetical protein